MMEDRPFDIVEPDAGDSPVLVEVPHAGLQIDAQAASYMAAPSSSVARDADLYVDRLFANSPAAGATLLFARTSRCVVDLNRSEDDYDGAAVVGGPSRERPRGVIWRLSSDGLAVLNERIPASEYRRRIDLYYRPYHDAVARLLERKRRRFGFAVLLCAHSMPTPRGNGRRGVERQADLVPGSRGRTSASAEWIDLVEQVGCSHGWRVRHDAPYRGGYSTTHYGRPDAGIHAVQIEIARRLYMDERRLAPTTDGFEDVKRFATELVTEAVSQACVRAAAE
jgi:N-formylglutamate deformylase